MLLLLCFFFRKFTEILNHVCFFKRSPLGRELLFTFFIKPKKVFNDVFKNKNVAVGRILLPVATPWVGMGAGKDGGREICL